MFFIIAKNLLGYNDNEGVWIIFSPVERNEKCICKNSWRDTKNGKKKFTVYELFLTTI